MIKKLSVTKCYDETKCHSTIFSEFGLRSEKMYQLQLNGLKAETETFEGRNEAGLKEFSCHQIGLNDSKKVIV